MYILGGKRKACSLAASITEPQLYHHCKMTLNKQEKQVCYVGASNKNQHIIKYQCHDLPVNKCRHLYIIKNHLFSVGITIYYILHSFSYVFHIISSISDYYLSAFLALRKHSACYDTRRKCVLWKLQQRLGWKKMFHMEMS